MIPIDLDGEQRLLEIDGIFEDLAKEFKYKELTRTTLIALQMNLNEITETYLPIIVEDKGELYALIAYSLQFLDDGTIAFIAKLQYNSDIILDYFKGKKKGE